MPKKYTLIVEVDNNNIVVLTDDPIAYMRSKRYRVKTQILRFCTEGDKRGKIKRFGVNDFLETIKSRDLYVEYSLKFYFDKKI